MTFGHKPPYLGEDDRACPRTGHASAWTARLRNRRCAWLLRAAGGNARARSRRPRGTAGRGGRPGHLGDYVDRGMESAQVVEWLLAGPPVPAQVVVNLMGNHEQMMLSAIATADQDGGRAVAAQRWGGFADELGRAASRRSRDWAGRSAVPHLVFLRDLALRHQIGAYLFVHAGIRPGVPLGSRAGRTCCRSASRSCPRRRITGWWSCMAIPRDGSLWAESHRHRYRGGDGRGADLRRIGGRPLGFLHHMNIACMRPRLPTLRRSHESNLRRAAGARRRSRDPDLAAAVRRLANTSVLVIGDVMLDRYIYGDIRGSARRRRCRSCR